MSETSNYQEEVKLHILDLDKNALEQGELFAKYATYWAEAVNERDRLKEKIALKKGEVDSIVRQKPEDYGWDKPDKSPTETWVAYQVANHSEVVQLSEEMRIVQADVNIYLVAKEAFDHRQRGLTVLTELYKSNYFAATSRGLAMSAVDNLQEKQRLQMEDNPQMRKLIKKKEGQNG